MIEKQTKQIGEYEFTFMPLNPFKALVLDKKILSLLTPVLGGLRDLDKAGEGASISDIIDFKLVSEGLGEALGKMKDAEFESLSKDLLRSVIVETGTNGAHSCDTDRGAVVFSRNIGLMYEVMLEVMRYNKFSPFVLAERGDAIEKIVSSVAPNPKSKRRGVALGKSAS